MSYLAPLSSRFVRESLLRLPWILLVWGHTQSRCLATPGHFGTTYRQKQVRRAVQQGANTGEFVVRCVSKSQE